MKDDKDLEKGKVKDERASITSSTAAAGSSGATLQHLVLQSVVPDNGKTDVKNDPPPNIVLTFSTTVDANTTIQNNKANVLLLDDQLRNVSSNISITGTTVTIAPGKPLDSGKTYTVWVTTLFEDTNSNHLAIPFVSTFTTSPTPISLDGLHFTDDDPILRKLRKAAAQHFALDYLILQSYNLLIRALGRTAFWPGTNQEDIIYKYDPYKFTPSHSELTQIENSCEADAAAAPWSFSSPPPGNQMDLCSAFIIYIISINLQKMFSYVFINTKRIDELQHVDIDINQISDLLGTTATTDTLSDQVLNYIRDVRDNNIISQLEVAGYGAPLVDMYVEDFALSVIRVIADLSNKDAENTVPDDFKDMEEEFKREISLIKALFQGGSPTVFDVIQAAGLAKAFDTIRALLPDDITEVVDSPIFSQAIYAWSKLFPQAQTEYIDMIVSMMPTIKDRFITSITTNPPTESQQDFAYDCQRLILDFLDGALIPVRLDEIKKFLADPMATTFLKTFRSLRLVSIGTVNYGQGDETGTQEQGIWFNPDADPKGTLNYHFVMQWLLTPVRELNVLFRFAATQSDLKTYHISLDPGPNQNLVIPAAMFPGNLDSSGAALQIGVSIQSDLNNDTKRMAMKQDKVKRSGVLGDTLKADGIGWLI